MDPGGDEAGDVGDVGEQQRAALVGDRAERGPVDSPGVRTVAADDELGVARERELSDFVVVDGLGVATDVVLDHVVGAPRVVDVETVRKMTAVGQLHGQERVARVEEGEQGGQVGRGARVGLDVDVLGPEDGLAAVDGQLLDLVDDLAATVVPRPGEALGVLVGQHRARGLQDRAAGEVLAGDELERLLLADELAAQELVQLGIEVIERLAAPLPTDWAHEGSPSSSMRSTRLLWRPPSNGVASQISVIAHASSALRRRPPRHSTLASL